MNLDIRTIDDWRVYYGRNRFPLKSLRPCVYVLPVCISTKLVCESTVLSSLSAKVVATCQRCYPTLNYFYAMRSIFGHSWRPPTCAVHIEGMLDMRNRLACGLGRRVFVIRLLSWLTQIDAFSMAFRSCSANDSFVSIVIQKVHVWRFRFDDLIADMRFDSYPLRQYYDFRFRGELVKVHSLSSSRRGYQPWFPSLFER